MKLIVLVEDDPTIGDLMEEYIGDKGYQIEVFESGTEALDRIQREPAPGLILLDSRMPEMSGSQFMSEFKKIGGPAAKIPVHLFTAGDAEAESRRLGCSGFLKKPIELKALDKLLKSVFIPRPD